MKRLIVLLFIAFLSFTPRPAFAQNVHVRGYSIVLLLGDTQGASMPDSLSAPAKKALADVKDFLPYRSYRVVDTQWLAGSDGDIKSTGILRGDDVARPFNLSSSGRGTSYNFRLWGSDRSTILLDTTFSERPGETVVVGTSRVQGSTALVVLLSIVTDAGDSVYELGTPGLVAPVPTKKVKPAYTPEALKARISGMVSVSGIVRANGTLTDVAVVKSLDPVYGLDQAAVQNVMGWEFKPGMKDGKPVDVRVTIDVEYVANR